MTKDTVLFGYAQSCSQRQQRRMCRRCARRSGTPFFAESSGVYGVNRATLARQQPDATASHTGTRRAAELPSAAHKPAISQVFYPSVWRGNSP
jgi:hypothetical protein